MLNYLWSSMILAGTLWAAVHGRLDDVTQGALTAAKEAVALCVTMLGVMSLWTGVLEIGNSAGLIGQLSKAMRPVLRFLFPDLAPDSRAAEHISVNFIANMLGLGWAATPAGLKAMEELKKTEESRYAAGTSPYCSQTPPTPEARRDPPCLTTATPEMRTFLILNISSLQLIPVNIIAYRSQYGSPSPAAITGPCLAATAASTLAAVVFCRVMGRRSRR